MLKEVEHIKLFVDIQSDRIAVRVATMWTHTSPSTRIDCTGHMDINMYGHCELLFRKAPMLDWYSQYQG